MKKKTTRLFAAAGLLWAFSAAYASAPKIGTSAAPELMIPMGARNVAMGGANVANIQGVESIYWNPAGLSAVTGSEASFAYMPYFADMNISYFTAGIRLGRTGALGVSLQMFNVGDIEITTIEAPEGTGETIQPNFMTLGLSYSRQFTDRIRFGTNLKVVRENISTMYATGVAFDFGLQYISPWKVAFGVTLRNLGGSMTYDGTGIEFNTAIPWADPGATTRRTRLDMASAEMPTSMTMGLSYSYQLGEQQTINLSGLYSNNSYAVDNLSAGMEYGFDRMVYLRAGYALPLYPEDYPELIQDETQFGFACGGGLHIPAGGTTILLDYAYRDMQLFDANHYFSIGFRF
jgi:opacity protein-like surface antigen